jgi:lipopolysaccharide/colanic/teichoic acid biosynthesis glycosyltransferase
MMPPPTLDTFYARQGKRLFDLLLAVPALIVSAPFMLLIALIIRLESRGPALFMQERTGRSGNPFLAYKYRTMIDRPRQFDTLFFSGDPSEITTVGRFLRRMKIDELPQLINVVQGNMSLVGPRPQLTIQLDDIRADVNGCLRLLVRPGLTGMAQTHGGVALSWPERWFYDGDYVRKLSLALDVWLILRTFAVLRRGEHSFAVHPPLLTAETDKRGQ